MSQGFTNATLNLNEPRSIYYSGQLLIGNIECTIARPVSYSVINVSFIGEANVYWTEENIVEYNGISKREDTVYSSHEDYFNVTQCISGGNGIVTIQPGVHKIPFQFQIPYASPSSFASSKGSVSYKVVAYIDYPDPSMSRHQIEKAFDVVAPLDFNKDNDFKQPLEVEFEEVYSCCCSSTPINLAISLPATGFCPGQTIPINIKAKNESNVEIKKITFSLIRKECYKATGSNYFPPEEVLETVKSSPILGNTSREITCRLAVPPMIAPNLENCSIIDVGFFFKVLVSLSGCNEDLEDETELWIGLVPLASLMSGEKYIHPLQSDLPQAPIPETPTIVPSPIPNSMAYPASAAMQNAANINTNMPCTNASPYLPKEAIPLNQYPPQPSGIGFVTNHQPENGYPHNMPNVTPYPQNVPNVTPYPQNVPNVAPYPQNMPNNTPYPQNLPHVTPYTHNMPNVTPYPQNTPNVTPYPQGMSNVSSYPVGNQGYPSSPSYGDVSAPPPY